MRLRSVVENPGKLEDKGQSHQDYLRGSWKNLKESRDTKCRVWVGRGHHSWKVNMIGRGREEMEVG